MSQCNCNPQALGMTKSELGYYVLPAMMAVTAVVIFLYVLPELDYAEEPKSRRR